MNRDRDNAPGGAGPIDSARAVTLSGLFAERVAQSPGKTACHEFDADAGEWRAWSWDELGREAGRWQRLFRELGLARGDCIALLHPNSRHWVCADQAALGLGLIVAPLYLEDRPANARYILGHAGACVLITHRLEQWRRIAADDGDGDDGGRGDDWMPQHVIVTGAPQPCDERRVLFAVERLPDSDTGAAAEFSALREDPHSLATIVYTSGTTGRPKGVMLSHANILVNIADCLQRVVVHPHDRFLSFLPLSHTLERTIGYYMVVMAGAEVVYNRSIEQLADDLREMRPTMLISVPRIFERVYDKLQARLEEGPALRRALFRCAVAVGWRRFERRQGRASWSPALLLWPLLRRLVAARVMTALGGRLRIAVSGGAPIPFHVAHTFIGLGLDLCQGYGLTETSPVLSANAPGDNMPQSVGKPVASVKLRIGDDDELQASGPNVMQGYWRDPEATRAVLDADGWLRTGDCARIEDGFVYITGRLKDVLVLSNGEKVPPADMESAISEDGLFEQVMVIGEGRPFLAALVVLDGDAWRRTAAGLGISADDAEALRSEKVETLLLERIAERIRHFPGYARIHKLSASLEPWSVENGLLTPTMKPRRKQILEAAGVEVERLYAGH